MQLLPQQTRYMYQCICQGYGEVVTELLAYDPGQFALLRLPGLLQDTLGYGPLYLTVYSRASESPTRASHPKKSWLRPIGGL
jgi:hypothetical protein